MSKIFITIIAIFLSMHIFTTPAWVWASGDLSSSDSPMLGERMIERLKTVGSFSGYNTEKIKETSLASMIGSLISVLLSLLGVVFIILTIYAGFTWMTSQGNEEKIKQASSSLKSSIIGLLITLSAWSIWEFIFIKFILK